MCSGHWTFVPDNQVHQVGEGPSSVWLHPVVYSISEALGAKAASFPDLVHGERTAYGLKLCSND